MKATRTIIILFVLLFSTMATYSQCDTYLQKANSLFAEKKYEDAKRQYSNYKECKPNAAGIDAKIAECDRLAKEIANSGTESNSNSATYRVSTSSGTQVSQPKEEKIYFNENWQGCPQYQAKYYRIVKYDTNGKPVGKIYDYYITGELQSEIDGAIYIDKINDHNSKFTGYTVGYYKNGVKSHETQRDNNGNILSSKSYDENGNLKVPRTKPAIGIGSFSGYKSNEAETNTRTAFVNDGRFIVSNVQNTYSYGANQQTSADIDYIVSGTCTLVQQARTETNYLNVPATKWTSAQSIPQTKTTQEIVNVDIIFTNIKTGQIVYTQTYNLNNLNRISGNIFPVKFSVNKVDGKEIGIVNITGGTYFIDDVFNVNEVYSNGGKSYLGKLKIGKTNDDCKITDGAKEIKKRFEAGANLVVEK